MAIIVVGGLGSVQLGGRLDGRGPRDLVPVVLFGYELAPKGLPEDPPAAGEVFADESSSSPQPIALKIFRSRRSTYGALVKVTPTDLYNPRL